MLPAACCSGLGASLRGPAAGICPERLGQPVRRPAPESCSFTHIVKEIKEQNSVPAPLCRPRCRAAPRAPRPGKQGPAVPPVGAARCHMAALPEARPRAGLRAAERGGGRGWPLASSLRARQRSSPARPTAASRTLPAGGRGRRGGRAREPRLGSLWFALLLCSPQTSFLERSWGVSSGAPLLLVRPFKEPGFRGENKLSKWNCFFSWTVTSVAGGRLARRR